MFLFNANKIALDRFGNPFKTAKPGPVGEGKAPEIIDSTYGSLALVALDLTLPSDQKAIQGDMPAWVRTCAKREKIADKISVAMADGGWAELDDDHKDTLVNRLAEAVAAVQGFSMAMVGPIIAALQDPPKAKE